MVKFGWDKLKRFLAQAQTWTGVQTFSSLVATTADINGGTIDGSVLGSSITNLQKGPAAITTFAGTVSTSGSSTTVTFTSAADAILAGYNASNPILGTTLIAGGNTRYIVSWTNSTTCVVDAAVTLAGSTAITSVQLPIATFVNSAGVTQGWMNAAGNVYISNLTSNYLPYVSAVNKSLINSSIYTDGTNIAIGKSSLFGYPLEVRTTTDTNFLIRLGADFGAGYSGTGLDVFNNANDTRKMMVIAGNPLVLIGNVGIGQIDFGTSAVKNLVIGEGTAPTTSPANASALWSADLNGAAGTNRLHQRTESGISSPIALQTEVDAALNPKAPSQAVALTAAASGSSGIMVADNDNIDFGTGNFTLVWRGNLPDWTSSTYPNFFNKHDGGSSGFIFRTAPGGEIGVRLNATDNWSSAVQSLADNTNHEITAVITVGAVNTTTDLYIDGVAFGSQLSIANAGSVTNAIALYTSGTSAVRVASRTSFAATFNRALTAAEVLDLYRNGVAESDRWGSQTSIITGNDSTFAGASNWANVDVNAYDETTGGVLTLTASAAGQYCTLPIANATTVANKKYRLEFDVPTLTATWTIKDFGGTVTIGTISATGTGQKIEFTASTTGGLRLVSVATTSAGTFDNFLLYEIGATLALTPAGIKTPKWFDSSSNALDGAYPTAGSSLTQEYQLGTESLLSITTVAFNADGDTTLYTVPTGRRLVLTKAVVVAGADAGATTALSIGANGTETDFVPAAVLSNLDAANDVVILQPVPVAALPSKNKSYAAGTVIQAQVATQSGGATNTIYLFGLLY
jgi:hypothetical protein